MEPLRVSRPAVAGLHYFDQEQEQYLDLDPDKHQSERSDPDRPGMEFRFLKYFTCQGT
jgi:hypothetical protein